MRMGTVVRRLRKATTKARRARAAQVKAQEFRATYERLAALRQQGR